jgi:hypothetical protein
MKTIVYVDGLNLYYAALRGTPFKWLDLYALFQDQVLEAGTDCLVALWQPRACQLLLQFDLAQPFHQTLVLDPVVAILELYN